MKERKNIERNAFKYNSANNFFVYAPHILGFIAIL